MGFAKCDLSSTCGDGIVDFHADADAALEEIELAGLTGDHRILMLLGRIDGYLDSFGPMARTDAIGLAPTDQIATD